MSNKEEFKISVSKAKTFADCKAKYNYSYIQKLPKKEREYHTFGKFCHAVLENFHQSYMDGSKNLFNVEMSSAWRKALPEYKDKMDDQMKKDCREIINYYLEKITLDKKDFSNLKVLGVEKYFYLNIGDNVILNGAIDKIEIDDDGIIHVADYKTSKNPKYLEKDFFQLLTYAYVLMSEDPSIEMIRGSYIMLKHKCSLITKSFYKDEILKIQDQYINYVNSMRTEVEFKTKPTVLCGWCDYLDICDSGKKMIKPNKTFGQVGY